MSVVAKFEIMFFFMFVIFTTLFLTTQALPDAIPLQANIPVNEAITIYHQRGIKYADIVQLLGLYHGLQITLDCLKKRIRAMGLPLRHGPTGHTIAEVYHAIMRHLPNMPITAGYREMTATLKFDGFNVRRNTVMQLMQRIDAQGIEVRRRRKLRRRIYTSLGPNHAWHIDGYDKLKPYGFAIHGAIDGYSRRIMWLEVGPSNNDPSCIAKYFVDCVQQHSGCPLLLQTDAGTENSTSAALQCSFRTEHGDPLAGLRSHRFCRSTANQRIEAWWSKFRRSRMEWWINFFHYLHTTGVLNKDNQLHIFCIRYTFMRLLQSELDAVAQRWNYHYIAGSPNARCPPGRPNVLYFLGEVDNLQPVSQEMIEWAIMHCRQQTLSGSVDFDEYAATVANNHNWLESETWQAALQQYEILLDIAQHGL